MYCVVPAKSVRQHLLPSSPLWGSFIYWFHLHHSRCFLVRQREPQVASDSTFNKWARQKSGKTQGTLSNLCHSPWQSPRRGRDPSRPLSFQIPRILLAPGSLSGSLWEYWQGLGLMFAHHRNGQSGRPGISLATSCLASWWGSELKRAFPKARASECNGVFPPLHLTG